jgi:L-alanine-DL-glutamate epimerase-like enolase superfamily enzyme
VRTLEIVRESWPVRGEFVIARGAKRAVEVLVVKLQAQDGAVGRGECRPYERYGESPDSVAAQIAGVSADIKAGLDRAGLIDRLPPGAARNALDCALWDLEAKRTGRPVWDLAGLPEPGSAVTAYTVSLGPPQAMAEAAREAAGRPLLKLKLGGEGDGDVERVAAVREAAPEARLIVDANEGWTADRLTRYAGPFAELGVELIEQPLPAGADDALAGYDGPVPLCADESAHDRASLPALAGRYAAVNVKLDKTGGLTEALALDAAARAAGFRVMVGCMLATSLALAPALLVAQRADWVDLDGPLLLAEDRTPGLRFAGSNVFPADPALWG